MRAVIWTKYGPPEVLQPGDVEKPTPRADEVLIRIHAASVTAADCELRAFKIFTVFWLPLRLYIGLFRPIRVRILGQDLGGQIEAIGKDVKRFKEGDQVFASTGIHLSTYAEYICLPEKAMMAPKPANMTYAEAASVPLGGYEAWHYLKGNVRAGQKMLVIGAGGSIGTFGVQLARYFGAEVTGVDSTDKLDLLRSIGAEHVIDYTREDYTGSGQTYDVIFDAPGKSSFSRCKGLLKPGGQFLSANPGLSDQIRTARRSARGGGMAAPEPVVSRSQVLVSLRELIEAGKIKSVVDRVYPLEQAADAHRYAESGRKKGNIALNLE